MLSKLYSPLRHTSYRQASFPSKFCSTKPSLPLNSSFLHIEIRPLARQYSTRDDTKHLTKEIPTLLLSAKQQQTKDEKFTKLESGKSRLQYLLTEWKKNFTPKYLKEDAVAGVTVAALALPLSLAISVASGVPSHVGLISAIVGGVVCATFGGSTLAISGPAAAMSVIVSTIVLKYGLSGIIVVTFLAGLMQIATGMLRFGKYIRYVPTPIIEGFTAGIGVIIAITQLPKALGIALPELPKGIDPSLLHTVQGVWDHIGQTNYGSLSLTIFTLAVILGLPKLIPKSNSLAPLVGIAAATGLNHALSLGAPVLGPIPSILQLPQFDPIAFSDIPVLAASAVMVYGVLSLETLLSAVATDKMMIERNNNLKIEKEYNHKLNSDQELVGQGIGNLAVSLVGGIPVTGVIARSATNVQVGAITRRSAVLHSGVLAASILAFSPVLSHIPICALSGLLLSVTVRMLHPRHFKHIYHLNKLEALPYLTTTAAIIGTDLLVGVQIGIASQLALLFLTKKHKALRYEIDSSAERHNVLLSGAINFLAANKLHDLQSEMLLKLRDVSDSRVSLLMDNVTSIDVTGAEELNSFFDLLDDENCDWKISGLSSEGARILTTARPKLLSTNRILLE